MSALAGPAPWPTVGGEAARGVRPCAWVTRAEPGATRTARRLRRTGWSALVAPVLEVRRLAAPPLSLDGVGALAFTSANAVRAFAETSPRRDLPVFAVGAATAAAARAAGFADVASADRDVGALVRLIVQDWRGRAGAVLHPCGADAAGDLAGDLRAAGIALSRLPLYETVPVGTPPPAAAAALRTSALDAVLVHSPKAARTIVEILSAPDLRAKAAELRWLGLSPACLAPLEPLGFAGLTAADLPTERALFAKLAA